MPDNWGYVWAAYLIVWGVLGGYGFSVLRHIRRLRTILARLEQGVAESPKEEQAP